MRQPLAYDVAIAKIIAALQRRGLEGHVTRRLDVWIAKRRPRRSRLTGVAR